jgi:hypothetical protein
MDIALDKDELEYGKETMLSVRVHFTFKGDKYFKIFRPC